MIYENVIRRPPGAGIVLRSFNRRYLRLVLLWVSPIAAGLRLDIRETNQSGCRIAKSLIATLINSDLKVVRTTQPNPHRTTRKASTLAQFYHGFYHVSPLVPHDLRLRHRSSSSISLKNLAEASGSRTHRRQENLPPAGFEDREDHRAPCASALSFNPYYAVSALPPSASFAAKHKLFR
jgi:hypothetical protein